MNMERLTLHLGMHDDEVTQEPNVVRPDETMVILDSALQRMDEQEEELRIKGNQLEAYEIKLGQAKTYLTIYEEEIKHLSEIVQVTPETAWNAAKFRTLRTFQANKPRLSPFNWIVASPPKEPTQTQTPADTTQAAVKQNAKAGCSSKQVDSDKAKIVKMKNDKDSKTDKPTSSATKATKAINTANGKATKIKTEEEAGQPTKAAGKTKRGVTLVEHSSTLQPPKKAKKEK